MGHMKILAGFFLLCLAGGPLFGGMGEIRLPWRYPGERLYYRSCGCADACWVAEVRDRRTSRVKARLRCDCEKLLFSLGDGAEDGPFADTCDSIQTSDKFKLIPDMMRKILGR